MYKCHMHLLWVLSRAPGVHTHCGILSRLLAIPLCTRESHPTLLRVPVGAVVKLALQAPTAGCTGPQTVTQVLSCLWMERGG